MLLFQGIFIFKTFPSQWTVSSDVLALLCGRSCRLVECKSKRLIKRKKEDEFNWRWLLSFLWSEKWILTAAIVAALVVAILNVHIPLLLGNLVNVVASLQPGLPVNHYFYQLARPGAPLALYYIGQGLLTSVYIALLSTAGERLAYNLRSSLFSSLIQQDIAFFDEGKTGELVNRLTTDVQDFKSSFKECISQGLRSITQVIGGVVSLYVISPQMTLLVVLGLPLMIGVGGLIGSGLRQLARRSQEQVAMATSVAVEALSNIRTVRAFAMEDKELVLYNTELKKSQRLNELLGYGIAAFQSLSNIGVVLAVVSHGGLLLATKRMTPGDLVSFLATAQIIQRSLGKISVLFGQVVRGLSAGARVFKYMETAPTIPLKGGEVLPHDSIRGKIEFKNVTFSYPTRPDQIVLEDFSLNIPAGKVTALCGLSGAGKSTVAALTERFYEVDKGQIEIDGHPIKSLDPTWLRSHLIGFINQEPVLFATTVMENIRYGEPSARDEEVIKAAQTANVHGFISDFPNGYETLVGERGHSVSGGQKQRIAIARALLKNPKVLILDEATSALDAESEHLVQQALDRVCRGRTVVVIAHRLSTIRDADNIAVLVKGKTKETGKHSDLLRQGGVYCELIRRQAVEGSLN